MKTIRHLVHCLLLSSCLYSFTAQAQGEKPKDDFVALSKRKSAPDFTINDVHGKPITLSKYKGRVVLLDFWVVACGGCKQELPWYVAFQSKYKDRGLSLIGLDMYGESPDLVRPFMEKWKMDFRWLSAPTLWVSALV